MNSARKIKVLIVDDSLVFRETLARGISSDSSIEVVATAADPFMARDKIIEFQPDVMTLDVEMPRMNGIEFLRRLMPQYPIPVIVVSAVSKNVFDALDAGAVEFVAKPQPGNLLGMSSFINELIVKIKIASVSKVAHWKKSDSGIKTAGTGHTDIENRIIAIGSSTGGTEAVYNILRAFPRDIPGILIVQHMPPNFTRMYAERLNNSCAIEVREAKDGDRVTPGCALIAPGDFHMRLRRTGGIYKVECFKGDKVNGHCPSVDVLFESVAQHAGSSAVGVILTGMGYDGAKGLLSMRRKGAKTLGQDEQSCVVYGMPKVAFNIGAVERQVHIENMAQAVYSVL